MESKEVKISLLFYQHYSSFIRTHGGQVRRVAFCSSIYILHWHHFWFEAVYKIHTYMYTRGIP